jgi:hypothetical protein
VRHQLVPSLGLRVRPVLDLHPTVAVVFVNPHFSLRHNPFKIASANLLKELSPLGFNVLSVDDSIAAAGVNQLTELSLALDQ